MRFVAHAYSYPKDEQYPADWEDGAGHQLQDGFGWFAVADGAGSGFHVKEWAQRLVTGFVTERPSSPRKLEALFYRECQRWSQEQDARLEAADDQVELPWWEEAAPIRLETAAAFVGVHARVTGERTGTFHAFAVGDCCVLHVRGATLLMSYPLSSPEAFGHDPALVYARPERMPEGIDWIQFSTGQLRPGDMLVLASDRLSQCLLRHSATSDGAVWQAMRLVNRRSFETLVRALREHASLDVDDVTLLRIAVE